MAGRCSITSSCSQSFHCTHVTSQVAKLPAQNPISRTQRSGVVRGDFQTASAVHETGGALAVGQGAPLSSRTAGVSHRVRNIFKRSELDAALESAGSRLVVLELMSDKECESGLFEAEDHWTPPSEQHDRKMQECAVLRDTFVKMASTSLSARFLSTVESEEQPSEIARSFNISAFPAVLFFRNKQVVWQVQGSHGMADDVFQGVLYYGGRQYVTSPKVVELKSLQDVKTFVSPHSSGKLKMIMATSHMCSPCIHVYPSFMTLAGTFGDQIDFARIDGDDEGVESVFEELGIIEVPTFLVYKDGKLLSKLISGQRGDLIGFLLNIAMENSIHVPSRNT